MQVLNQPSRALPLFDVMVQMTESGCLDNVLSKLMRVEALRQLCNLAGQFPIAIGNSYWKKLLSLLLEYCKQQQTRFSHMTVMCVVSLSHDLSVICFAIT